MIGSQPIVFVPRGERMEERIQALLLSIQLRALGIIQRKTEDDPGKWEAHLAAALMEDKLQQQLNEMGATDVKRSVYEFSETL